MCDNKCNKCIFDFTPKAERVNAVEAKEMSFFNDGKIEVAKMKPYNDAFYEIVEGKYKGNLVHRWDIM
jgi:hypothetical protein